MEESEGSEDSDEFKQFEIFPNHSKNILTRLETFYSSYRFVDNSRDLPNIFYSLEFATNAFIMKKYLEVVEYMKNKKRTFVMVLNYDNTTRIQKDPKCDRLYDFCRMKDIMIELLQDAGLIVTYHHFNLLGGHYIFCS